MKQEVGSTGRVLGPKGLLFHAESGDEKSICIASTKILFDSGSIQCKFMYFLLDSTVGLFTLVT